MKVQWLNEGLTRAMVTTGWLKKRYAIVVCKSTQWQNDKSEWRFESGNSVDDNTWWYVGRSRRNTLEARRTNEDWKPVTKLPEARIVR